MYWQQRRSQTIALSVDEIISLPVKHFLTITTCPHEWIHHDLYLFRDETTAFYIGQSDCAFARVWSHLQDGFKGRSLIGKFIRVNWPRSMRFTIELMDSASDAFRPMQHDRNEAERILITDLGPCFNDTFNAQPSELPPHYVSPQKSVRYPRHIRNIILESEHAIRQEQNALSWD